MTTTDARSEVVDLLLEVRDRLARDLGRALDDRVFAPIPPDSTKVTP